MRLESLEARTLLTAAPLGVEYQLNTTVALDQSAVAIGSHPLATQVIMAWVSNGQDGSGDGVYAQRYDLNGNRIGSAFRVNGATSGAQNAPAVAMDSLGNFVVAWQSSSDGNGNGYGVYARRFGYDATALAAEFRVHANAAGDQLAPAIAMNDTGDLAIAYQSTSRDGSGTAVLARFYPANATASADTQVNEVVAGNQQSPAIAIDAAGNVTVAWQSAGQDGNSDAVVMRRFTRSGSSLTSEVVVNQTTTGSQSAPAVAAAADGAFVLAWQSAGQDGSGNAIVAQRFDNTGAAIGGEVLVNQYTAGNQSAPSVSASAAGFVIAWQSAGQDGNGDAVVARQFATNGTAGDEFVVNTFVTGAQNNPAVAIQNDGDFVVAWQSPGQEVGGGSTLGVFARRYNNANDAPVLRQIANQVVDLGGTLTFTATARDEDAPLDVVSYSLAPGAPAGATIDPQTGLVSWSTAGGVAAGRYFVTVEARDTAGLVDRKQVAITVFAPGERTALDNFVNAVDANYSWDIRGRTVGDGYVKYNVLLTSGNWRTAAEVDKPLWQHWMSVYVPDVITSSRAVLFIDGGSSSSTPPANSDIDSYANLIVASSGTVFVDLYNVPSQPLKFAGETSSRSEDSIIAYSWRKYLETGDETWPVNLPMTRAAMRAMDAVSDFLGSPVGGNFDIASFVVSGGSKRGWTTWLSAATDPRVSEIVPIVSDLLNMQTSFVHHYAYYNGTFSAAVQDYVREGVLDVNKFGTDGIDSLLSIVDPYTYLNRLTLPKYLVNVSGDEFFVPDSWSFYYNDLLGPKSMRYLPNSSHGISDPTYYLDIFSTMFSMLYEEPLPEYSFQQLPDGTIELQTDATVVDAKLWKATNTTARDFRWPVVGAAYTSTTLTDQGGGVFRGNVPTPTKGWTAYFVEITTENEAGHQVKVTSGIYIKGPPTNSQPTLAPFADVVIPEGSPLTVQTQAADADSSQSLTYSLVSPPAGVTINPVTGVVSGVWTDQIASPLSVIVAVWDNGTPPLPNRDTFKITVVNAAPTLAIDAPTSGVPGEVQFTLLATDPSVVDQAAGFTFQIDWNNDGIVDQSLQGPSGTVVSHVFGPGQQVVRITATDKDGGQSQAATHTLQLNQAPVDPQNLLPFSIAEGEDLLLAALGWVDPDNDPLTYTWDLNNDGLFGDATGAQATVAWSSLVALGLGNGPLTTALRVRVDDGRGGVTTSASVTWTIVNAPPVATVSGPSTALRGEVQLFTLTATDPSAADSEFAYSIDWGDGSPIQLVTAGATVQVVHGFSATGPLTVTVTVADTDGAASAPVTTGIAIDAVQLRQNAQNPALVDLVWGGTAGDDRVAFEQAPDDKIRIRETLLRGAATNQVQEISGITGRVIALAGAGNDVLDARGLASKQATLNGNGGNNTLYGGSAGDILIGGSNGGEGRQGSNVIIAGNGDNTIYGNDAVGAEGSSGGNNLIVGGTGRDFIYGSYGAVHKKNGTLSNGGEGGQNLIVGGGGDDAIYASQSADGAEGGHGSILIAGTTTLDPTALQAVLAEWTSARTYEERVANIQGTGSGERLNGDYFLQAGVTVRNDSAFDQLYSDTKGKLNWLYYTLGQDIAQRVKPGETATNTP